MCETLQVSNSGYYDWVDRPPSARQKANQALAIQIHNAFTISDETYGMPARQLPNDWLSRYGFQPVLLETFVEYERHKGTCYKAANWINVARTAGRGKKSISHERLIPAKDIWL